ncbi:MAG: DUF3987 domain-containing protein [Bacteroidaceae bacterium]|nr:DUF3987 domain-containing protein [Bacteroidaceae bacterium]
MQSDNKLVFNPLDWVGSPRESIGDNKSSVNNDSEHTAITQYDNTSTTEQIEAVTALIESNGINLADDYGNWVTIGMALAHEMGEAGRDIFHRVSRVSSKYTMGECEKKYDNCLRTSNGRTTIGSFFHLAKEAGIDISSVARDVAIKNERMPTMPPMPTLPIGNENGIENGHKEDTSSQHTDNNINTNNNINNIENMDTDFANRCQDDKVASVASVTSVTKMEDVKGEDSADESVDLPTFSDKIDAEDWSPFMQEVIKSQELYSSKDLMVLGSVFTLSSVTPNYFGLYDGRKVFASGYIAITAPAASGKGDIAVCRNLVEPVEKEIHDANIKETEEYQKELATWSVLDKKQKAEMPQPKEPPFRSLLISANSSTTAVCQAINDNHGNGLIFESEGITMASTLRTEFGDYSDVLCKAFQHERISYTRRTEHEHVDIACPRLSMVLTLTPGQVSSLIPSFESGLGSRIPIYRLARNLVWRDVFETKDMTNEERFNLLGSRYLNLYHELEKRKEHPLQFVVSDSQKKAFNDYFSQLQLEQVKMLGDDLVAIVRRLGLICFRMAMVLTLLRRVNMKEDETKAAFEDDEQAIVCDDRDFRIAMTISNCLIDHEAYVYSNLVPHTDTSTMQTLRSKATGPKAQLLNDLPDSFINQDLYRIAERLHISKRTASRYLGEYINVMQVVKRIKIGAFCKISAKTEDESSANERNTTQHTT